MTAKARMTSETEAVVTDTCTDPPLITRGQRGHITEEISLANTEF